MEYKYWNQNNYPDIPYGDGTVASSGCGLCSACMVVENLTGQSFTPAEAVELAKKDKKKGKPTAQALDETRGDNDEK